MESGVGRDGSQVGFGTRVLRVLHGGEGFRDALFHGGDLDVTGDDEGHFTRNIVALVKVDEALADGVFDDFFDADGEAMGDERVRYEELELLFHEAGLHGVAGVFLGKNDAAFGIDFFGLEESSVGEVAHHGEGEIEGGFGEVGEVEHVDGLVERGVGVGVGPEGDAEALHLRDQLFGVGEVARAIENHVLQEVGHAALVVGFHEGAGVDVETERNALGRFGVGNDDVAEAVFEGAEGGALVGGNVTGFVGPRDAGSGGEGGFFGFFLRGIAGSSVSACSW